MGGPAKRQEEVTRIIVCDTGPLLHLSEAGVAHLLPLAGKVLIPPFVAAEFEANTQGWNPPQWVQVVALEKSRQRKVERWMSTEHIHSGEAEAIGLALQEHADWLLTDDAMARQFAASLGLEVMAPLRSSCGAWQQELYRRRSLRFN